MSDEFPSETEEIFNRSLMRGYMTNTWGQLGTAGLAFLISCFINPVMILTFIAAAGCVSVIHRCATIPKDMRPSVNMAEVAAQVVLALLLALPTVGVLLFMFGVLILGGVLSAFS